VGCHRCGRLQQRFLGFLALQALNAKCCKRCEYSSDEYLYFKARAQLASELDIKRILRSLRLMRAFIKFKTNRKERQLLRMQAASNVIVLNEEEDLTELKNLQNDSLKENLI
jgi:hypothetical protein